MRKGIDKSFNSSEYEFKKVNLDFSGDKFF